MIVMTWYELLFKIYFSKLRPGNGMGVRVEFWTGFWIGLGVRLHGKCQFQDKVWGKGRVSVFGFKFGVGVGVGFFGWSLGLSLYFKF